MINSEFVREVSKRMGISLADAKWCVSGVFDTLVEQILKEDEDRVIIKKLGTFKKKIRKSKCRGDMNTGEIVTDPARFVVSFTPNVKLDTALRELKIK